MSRTQIKLRIDSDWVIGGLDGEIGPEQGAEYAKLNEGEIGVKPTVSVIDFRSGVEDGTPWNFSPPLHRGSISGAPLAVITPEGSGSSQQTLVAWRGSKFVADADPIEFAATQSGVVVYDDSEDEWGVVAGAVVPTALDGGTYEDDFELPSFTSSILIGAPS